MSPDLRSLRQVGVADVWKGDTLAATLRRTDDGIVFAYDEAYLQAGGPSVATTLPRSIDPVVTVGGAVPPYFAGLLPEGRRLSALRDAVKTSLDDELSLVLAIGGDPIGDVRIVPSGAREAIADPGVSWSEGDHVIFREMLEQGGLLERRGMAGVQDKVSAAMLTLPATSSGRDAIVKLTPPEYPHLVENEAWFLALAKSAGLPTPRFRLVADATGELGLLIERFDRDMADGRTVRFAVEDGAQVLGLYPADKYRVSSEQVVLALCGVCAAPRVAARDLFRLMLFAWLTGNGDLHAKNASIIERDGEWRVAPAYDLPCSLPYGDDTMALNLAGRDHDLSRKAFLEFADAIDLRAAAAEQVIDRMLAATEPAVDLFRSQAEPFTRPRNAQALAHLVNRRRLLTLR